jgi:hypothetical protein
MTSAIEFASHSRRKPFRPLAYHQLPVRETGAAFEAPSAGSSLLSLVRAHWIRSLFVALAVLGGAVGVVYGVDPGLFSSSRTIGLGDPTPVTSQLKHSSSSSSTGSVFQRLPSSSSSTGMGDARSSSSSSTGPSPSSSSTGSSSSSTGLPGSAPSSTSSFYSSSTGSIGSSTGASSTVVSTGIPPVPYFDIPLSSCPLYDVYGHLVAGFALPCTPAPFAAFPNMTGILVNQTSLVSIGIPNGVAPSSHAMALWFYPTSAASLSSTTTNPAVLVSMNPMMMKINASAVMCETDTNIGRIATPGYPVTLGNAYYTACQWNSNSNTLQMSVWEYSNDGTLITFTSLTTGQIITNRFWNQFRGDVFIGGNVVDIVFNGFKFWTYAPSQSDLQYYVDRRVDPLVHPPYFQYMLDGCSLVDSYSNTYLSITPPCTPYTFNIPNKKGAILNTQSAQVYVRYPPNVAPTSYSYATWFSPTVAASISTDGYIIAGNIGLRIMSSQVVCESNHNGGTGQTPGHPLNVGYSYFVDCQWSYAPINTVSMLLWEYDTTGQLLGMYNKTSATFIPNGIGNRFDGEFIIGIAGASAVGIALDNIMMFTRWLPIQELQYFANITMSTPFGAPLCTTCTTANIVPQRFDGTTVYFIPHSHDDLGWLKTITDYSQGTSLTSFGANYMGPVSTNLIYSTVLDQLALDPTRRFQFAEIGFYSLFYAQASSYYKTLAQQFLASGQLIFINGGMVQHDEACTHYADMVDQTAQGHQFLYNTYGIRPTIGWQIDPFGHSSTNSILAGQLGFEGNFYTRLDFEDRINRISTRNTEFVARSSASLGTDAEVFTYAFHDASYSPISDFCFDSTDAINPITYNCGDANNRVSNDTISRAILDEFYYWVSGMQAGFKGGHQVPLFMGGDFAYQGVGGASWYRNMDALIKWVNLDGRVKLKYGTMEEYTRAKKAENVVYPIKTDDMFPYISAVNEAWTGYFTTRPTLKGHVRQGSANLFSSRVLSAVLKDTNLTASTALWTAVSLLQHHDAVTGTAKQAVTDDYHAIMAAGRTKAMDFMASQLNAQTNGNVQLAACQLLNMTVCPISESSNNLVVVIFNPIARARKMNVQLPFNYTTVQVTNSAGTVIPCEVMPLRYNNAYQAGLLHSGPLANHVMAAYTLEFQVPLPALGFDTFFIVYSATSALVTPPSTPIENAAYRLNLDASGRVSGIYDKASSRNIPFDISFGHNNPNGYDSVYTLGTDSYMASNSFSTVATPYATPTAIRTGANSYYVNLATSSVSYFVRLRDDHIEVEWSVATANPSIISVRYNTGTGVGSINNYNGNLNTTWYTDSNGREMIKRQYNTKPYPNSYMANSAYGYNMYPTTTAASIRDSATEMTVLVDRSQGSTALPMYPGSLEFMIHHATATTGYGGMQESSLETDWAAYGSNNIAARMGNPIVATGKHRIFFTSPTLTSQTLRPMQERMYHQPELFIGVLPTNRTDYLAQAGVVTAKSFILNALPKNVELMTLQPMGAGRVLLRLSHAFALGEDSVYSAPVTVDVNTLFNGLTVTNVVETIITGTIAKSSITPSPRWKTDDINTNNGYTRTGGVSGTMITIDPMDVKTLLITLS